MGWIGGGGRMARWARSPIPHSFEDSEQLFDGIGLLTVVRRRILNIETRPSVRIHSSRLDRSHEALDIGATIKGILVGPPGEPDDVLLATFDRRPLIE